MTLRLSLVVDGDASGARKAADEAKRAVEGVGRSASTAATAIAAANRNSAASVEPLNVAWGAAQGAAAGLGETSAQAAAIVTQASSSAAVAIGEIDASAGQAAGGLTDLGEGAALSAATVAASAAKAERAIGAIGASARASATLGAVALGEVAAAADKATGAAAGIGPAFADAGTRASGAVQLTSQQLAGMQFQMQDLGVMLASGQSPFMALLQQGSQVVQMFGPGVGVGGALRAVGAGIITFVSNPLNLALLGFSALAGGASLAWSAIAGGADDADAALEHHAELIRRVRDTWPEAVEGARDYGRETAEVMEAELRGSIIQIESDIKRLSGEAVGAVEAMLPTLSFGDIAGESGRASADIEGLRAAIMRLKDEAARGEPDIRAFRRAVAEIAQSQPTDAALQQLAAELLALTEEAFRNASALDTAEAAVARLGSTASSQIAQVDALGDALRSLQGIALPNLSDREEAAAALGKARREAFDRSDVLVAEGEYAAALGRIAAEEQRIADERAARAATRPAGSGSRRVGVDDAVQERDAVQGVIGALSEEYALLQLADRERAVQNALRQAGAAATAAERDEIRAIVGATYDLAEAQAQSAAATANARGAVGGMISAFRQARASGEGLFGALLAAAESFQQKLLDLAQDSFLDRLFSGAGGAGGGGGILGGIGGWLSGLFGGTSLSGAGLFAQGAAFGDGIVTRPTAFVYGQGAGQGALGVMGEAGPEAVVPLTRKGSSLAVGAVRGSGSGGETALPLARLASGRLGVALPAPTRFAAGGVFAGPVLPAWGASATADLAAPGSGPSRGGAPAAAVNNFYIQSPNPRAFAEDRVSVYRGADRLMRQAGRHS